MVDGEHFVKRKMLVNTRLQTKFNCSDGRPDRARQLLKYKTFVDWGKGKSNYEICNLSRLRTKALQG